MLSTIAAAPRRRPMTAEDELRGPGQGQCRRWIGGSDGLRSATRLQGRCTRCSLRVVRERQSDRALLLEARRLSIGAEQVRIRAGAARATPPPPPSPSAIWRRRATPTRPIAAARWSSARNARASEQHGGRDMGAVSSSQASTARRQMRTPPWRRSSVEGRRARRAPTGPGPGARGTEACGSPTPKLPPPPRRPQSRYPSLDVLGHVEQTSPSAMTTLRGLESTQYDDPAIRHGVGQPMHRPAERSTRPTLGAYRRGRRRDGQGSWLPRGPPFRVQSGRRGAPPPTTDAALFTDRRRGTWLRKSGTQVDGRTRPSLRCGVRPCCGRQAAAEPAVAVVATGPRRSPQQTCAGRHTGVHSHRRRSMEQFQTARAAS